MGTSAGVPGSRGGGDGYETAELIDLARSWTFVTGLFSGS
jgi:hypothetical protein